MIHKPIQIKNLSLSLAHKTCFEDFNAQIPYGSRIAVIGRNGCGKTTLLKILCGMVAPTSGVVQCGDDVAFGFVPQIIEGFSSLSGGQRLNKALTYALRGNPNVLLLDEPTNHLDHHHRKSLMRLLKSYPGTLIVVSHDVELLRHSINTLWHIDNGRIHVFSGNYDDYRQEIQNHQTSLEQELSRLGRQKKDMHHALMKEQKRAARSKLKGEKSISRRKWPTVVSSAKAGRAEETSGRKKSALDHKKQDLTKRLTDLSLPEIIVPKFSMNPAFIGDHTLVSIREGSIGYHGQAPILQKINLSMKSTDRIAIQGNNASGKSTLVKAILNDAGVLRSGEWTVPKLVDIGYLDQHYGTLSPEKTVCEIIEDAAPTWLQGEVRRYLNDFLFRKNEEVNAPVKQLSGGEKARLSLARIAASPPKLLILDEITNNLDLETKGHVIDILKNYPGAMIVISHEPDFLKEIGIHTAYHITERVLSRR